jgi:putative nucleotidyltransferase with HDIG domain
MAKVRKGRPKRKLLIATSILAFGLVVVYAAMILLAQPVAYDLRVGDVAQQTIAATKDVVDEINTEQRRQEARERVAQMTTIDNTVTERVLERVDSMFASIQEQRVVFQNYRENYNSYRPSYGEGTQGATVDEVEPDASALRRLLNTITPYFDEAIAEQTDDAETPKSIIVSETQLRALLQATDAEYTAFRETVAGMIAQTMEDGLRDTHVDAEIMEMRNEIYSVALNLRNDLRPFANNIFEAMVVANEFIDEDGTARAQEEAAAAVEPIIYKKGQTIVREGDPVQENELAMIEALGMLQESQRPDIALYIGMALLTALLGMITAMNLWNAERTLTQEPTRALLIVAVLISPQVARAINLLLGVMIGVLAVGAEGVFSSSMIEMLMVSQIGGIVATFSLGRVQRRTTVLISGLWTALASAGAMVGIGLMTNLNLDETFLRAGLVAVGAIISAILVVGCLPLLESVFGIMTQQKLLELSNPNQPLLRMLQLEAPGTYHHALLVANLAEAAADVVGANALLCRVGAYYHDVGKVKRPMYFKENQLDEVNPHDGMSPQVSAAILAEHVRDGRVMAEREKLPQPIIDIISQHHGTTTMAYFLYRAKKEAEMIGEEVSEEDYRYDGPIPQTKEAAIIFLADSVEAAVRSLKDHSSDSIQGMIRKLISERMHDGQLADVPLTLKEFHLMEKAFMRVLGGIYHTRVEYPELDKPKKEEEKAL